MCIGMSYNQSVGSTKRLQLKKDVHRICCAVAHGNDGRLSMLWMRHCDRVGNNKGTSQ